MVFRSSGRESGAAYFVHVYCWPILIMCLVLQMARHMCSDSSISADGHVAQIIPYDVTTMYAGTKQSAY